MEDVEDIPWNSNLKDGLRYKHITNCVKKFMPLLDPTCNFCNLQYRLPTSSPKDWLFMMHITRCILDAGWGMEPSNIKNHLWEVNRYVTNFKEIGKAPSYLYLVPQPAKDLLGMGPPVDMLMRSLDPGRLSTFAQFNSFRSSWSYFSAVCKESINGVLEGALLGEDHMRKAVLTKCSTQTIWFERFVREVELRFGSKYSPDQEISIEVIKLVMTNMEVAVKGKV